MNSRPKYCSNCSEPLENLNYEEIKKCPKCGIDLQTGSSRNTSSSSIVEQLPYKSPGTAALIAFIGGIFGLQGIGHMYVGKVGKGIGILIAGIIIAALLVFISISLEISLLFVFGVAYLVLWIWQIFDARKLAKKFNESVRITGKEPW
jgi:TM2 domain-containing membrane protein YozV